MLWQILKLLIVSEFSQSIFFGPRAEESLLAVLESKAIKLTFLYALFDA